jgi:cytochrome c peroxidase
MGRVGAVREARADPFNCLGHFNDDPDADCAELRFARTGDELIGAHKTPSLRNVALTPPYMHAGQMNSLTEIIDQYDRAPLALVGHSEAKPLDLSRNERKQLEAFLHTLSGPLATSPEWLAAP